MSTASSSSETFAGKLSALRARFLVSTQQMVTSFRAQGSALAAAPTSPEILERLCGDLHRVRGTAGSFGFPAVSALAEALEGRVKAWAADPACDVDIRSRLLLEFADRLEAELPRSASAEP